MPTSIPCLSGGTTGRLLTLAVLGSALLAPLTAQQPPTPVITIDLVKAKPGQRERLIRFYQLNWEQRRIEAKARGMISNYRLMVSADTGSRWDVMLETEYPDSAAFQARERNFGELIARNPAQPVDGMMRAALGDIVESRDLVLQTRAPTTTVVDARINQYCHEPDPCELRGALLWDTTNVTPRYPEVMRSVGIQGEVRLRFTVQPDGTVPAESIVIDRSTHRAFEHVSSDAVRQWKFRIQSQDRPVAAVETGITISYALADRCPADWSGPLTSLASRGPDVRLIVMVCPFKGQPRDEVKPAS